MDPKKKEKLYYFNMNFVKNTRSTYQYRVLLKCLDDMVRLLKQHKEILLDWV